ncbi:hypothetical protein F2P81_009888 [Scophthalmus maximus]|uniref:Uncharacterized protein n=1 Tax=Scophthalmus maximus TaxID=52904 RepID=A0A6A4T182_SCOMX|nr:hypothetical protein F2P81_009888 [Scophthalmus maximus]
MKTLRKHCTLDRNSRLGNSAGPDRLTLGAPLWYKSLDFAPETAAASATGQKRERRASTPRAGRICVNTPLASESPTALRTARPVQLM